MAFVWRTGRAMGRQLHEAKAMLFGRHTLMCAEVVRGGRPRLVAAPGAAEALAEARGAGLRVGICDGQPAVGARAGVVMSPASARVQVDWMLGPFDVWQGCPHEPADRCCAPTPRLLLEAARGMGVSGHDLVVISDTGSDMGAAQGAGAVGILVPTARTLRAEIAHVPLVAPDLISAVRGVLGTDQRWLIECSPTHRSLRSPVPEPA